MWKTTAKVLTRAPIRKNTGWVWRESAHASPTGKEPGRLILLNPPELQFTSKSRSEMEILIIEDHQVVAEGISVMLNGLAYVEKVSHVSDGQSGAAFLQENSGTDIVLLDINLPDCSGIELCATLKQKFPAVKIIALSTYSQAGIINKMLENGADSYLLKNAGSQDLKETIEKVSSGKKFLTAEIKNILNTTALITSRTPVFTKREKEVLALIAEGLTNQEIADQLFISQLTVISHRKSLLEKTESKNTAQLIKYCFESGLL